VSRHCVSGDGARVQQNPHAGCADLALKCVVDDESPAEFHLEWSNFQVKKLRALPPPWMHLCGRLDRLHYISYRT